MKHLILLFITLLFVSTISQAQEKKAQIKGYVFVSKNEPAMYATVVLMNKDSVFMKGALSAEDGSYVLDNIAPGRYLVMIRNIGFKNHVSAPVVISKNEIIVLDSIHLVTNINELSQVVVTGKKAMLEVLPDKMVYNVAQSANAAGSTGLELLAKSPGVVVDMDKNIILQGKSGVQIFINGRPTRLGGTDLANLLESIRSDNVESIEIITNPSSKYDAEGTGGIINIKLKKNANLGLNGNLNAGFSQGKYARKSLGGSINYVAEKLSFNTSINVSDNDFQTDILENTTQNGFLLDKKSYSVNNRKGYNISSGMDYKFNARHSASFDGRIFINKSNNRLHSSTGIYDSAATAPFEILKAETYDKVATDNYLLNFNYRYTPNSNTSLSTDFSIGTYSNNKGTEQPNDYYDSEMVNILRSSNAQYNSDTYIDLWSGMIDYEKKFKSVTLSSGAKYSSISTKNKLAFYNVENETPVFDSTRSNDFTYSEKVFALYFILNAKPTKKISFNAGLRMENTASLGRLNSEIAIENSEVPRNYTDFFPNLSVSFDDQKNSVISASYGKRITRPNYQDLNPFESRSSELNAWKGNPFLKPNYITNYQITYSFKRKLVISNTYSVTKDFFANIFIISSDKGNILSPRNMQKSTNNGLSVNYTQQVVKWWELTSFLIYSYSTYEGDVEGAKIDLKSNNLNFRLQNNLKLPADITADVTYFVSSPWIWGGTVQVDAYQGLNIGLKKYFMDRRFLLQLTGNDIFRGSSDYYHHSNYGGMYVKGVIIFDNQRFGINLTYNFGNQKAKARNKSKSAIDSEMNRISD